MTLPLCLCHVNYPIILHMTRLFYVEIFIIIFIFCVQLLRENSSPDIWALPEEGVSFPLMTASPHEVVTLFNVLGIPAYSHAKKPSGWEIRVGGFCGTKDLGFGFPFLPQWADQSTCQIVLKRCGWCARDIRWKTALTNYHSRHFWLVKFWVHLEYFFFCLGESKEQICQNSFGQSRTTTWAPLIDVWLRITLAIVSIKVCSGKSNLSWQHIKICLRPARKKFNWGVSWKI